MKAIRKSRSGVLNYSIENEKPKNKKKTMNIMLNISSEITPWTLTSPTEATISKSKVIKTNTPQKDITEDKATKPKNSETNENVNDNQMKKNEFTTKRMSSDNTEKEKIRIKFKKHSTSIVRMLPPRHEKLDQKQANKNENQPKEIENESKNIENKEYENKIDLQQNQKQSPELDSQSKKLEIINSARESENYVYQFVLSPPKKHTVSTLKD